jgi:hypothetical protein
VTVARRTAQRSVVVGVHVGTCIEELLDHHVVAVQ